MPRSNSSAPKLQRVKKTPHPTKKNSKDTKNIKRAIDYYQTGADQVWMTLDAMKHKLQEVLDIARSHPEALTMEAAFHFANVFHIDAYRWRSNNPELDFYFKQIKSAISIRRYNGAAFSKLNYRVILPTQHFYCQEHETLYQTERSDKERKLVANETANKMLTPNAIINCIDHAKD